MSLVRFEPLRDMRSLRSSIDRMFEDFLSPYSTLSSQNSLVALDMYEDGDNLIIEANLAGFKEEDVNIEVHGNSLRLTGEIKPQQAQQNPQKNYYLRERQYGRFERIVPLPYRVESDQARAVFENGTLKITLPRSEETKAKKIQILKGSGEKQALNS
ncbi:Hsp20/alpha crystallin family protein [Deinococcus cellulosilyticus]|uniref:Molecular chaperone Hsp20 n=1 Tax=Deinococcus cellulosilyticus (strain DSM 18568 / NBRC 106333 / KACC 11606 / 5516J-15) TaxID=1223518 RepID=A0A511N5B9_DEIC1|nr:Hsp20/alpha crystallin family protein [Deinococcus cellulosilyticus]GEM48052.1 molecular chaperone Hsp20 [Deinococcus cellulosilyticus NBRC 106333 = KACC 11606]